MKTVTETLARMLPWSQEAEQSVLGALLIDAPVAWDRIQPLDRRQFFDERHATIFGAMGEMVARHQVIDVVTVLEFLRTVGAEERVGGLAYLNSLAVCVPSARNAGAYAKRVRELYTQRQLLEAADKALELAADPSKEVSAKLDEITSLFGGIQRQQVARSPRQLYEVALERTQHYQELADGRVSSGWPTHLAWLNRKLGGGLKPGKLYYVAARPAVGKSSFSLELARRSGLTSLVLSMEMSDEELADRAIASAGRVSHDRLQSGRFEDSDWKAIVDAVGDEAMRRMYVDDQPALTLADIRTKAKQVPGLQLLVVDYLQLASGSSGHGANRNTEIEQISRGLKALAKELGVAVIALSQLNRAVEQRPDRRPRLSDLRDSGSVEQDADAVMFLWPVRDLPNGARLVGIDVAKNRSGSTGEIGLHFDGDTQTWAESTESVANSNVRSTGGSGRRYMGEDD